MDSPESQHEPVEVGTVQNPGAAVSDVTRLSGRLLLQMTKG